MKQLLADGYRVAAISRTKSSLVQAVREGSEQFLPPEVDLQFDFDVQQSIQYVQSHFDELHVAVSNAEYAQFGTLEELSEEEARSNFTSKNLVRSMLFGTACHTCGGSDPDTHLYSQSGFRIFLLHKFYKKPI